MKDVRMHQIVIRTPNALLAKFVECVAENRLPPFNDALWRLLSCCNNYMVPGKPCRAHIWITERDPDDLYFHIEQDPETEVQGSGKRLVAGTLHYHRDTKTWGIHT